MKRRPQTFGRAVPPLVWRAALNMLSSSRFDSPWASAEDAAESDALRLRKALHAIKGKLNVNDTKISALVESWQDALESSDRCESRAAMLREEAEALDAHAVEHRQKAEECFRLASHTLSHAARDIHLETAPFVQIEDQQALQLQSWLQTGRNKWAPVRLTLGGGQLVYTRLSRSCISRRMARIQSSIPISHIESASADGDAFVSRGCCGCCRGVEARWQWTVILSSAGRKRAGGASALRFYCESELAMHYWVRELQMALGIDTAPLDLPPAAVTAAAPGLSAPVTPGRFLADRAAEEALPAGWPSASPVPSSIDMFSTRRQTPQASPSRSPARPLARRSPTRSAERAAAAAKLQRAARARRGSSADADDASGSDFSDWDRRGKELLLTISCAERPLGVSLSAEGVVTRVSATGAAASALRIGDRVLKVDGRPLRGGRPTLAPGSEHTFAVTRGGGGGDGRWPNHGSARGSAERTRQWM